MLRYITFTPLLVFVTFLLILHAQGAKILCVSQQFGSHMLMVHSVAEGLIERGHEVYTLFSDKMKVPKELQEKGFKVLRYHTPEGHQIMTMKSSSKDLVEGILRKGNERESFFGFSAIALGECKDMDNDAGLHKQMLDIGFDLAIVDTFLLSYCMTFVPLKLGIPYVMVPSTLDIETSRTPMLPSFIPSIITLFTDDMTFVERIKNSYTTLSHNWPWLMGLPALLDLTLLEKYNKDPEVKSWNDWGRKAELFFHSRGYALEYPTPMTPNVITVECLTCKPGKPLSKSMEDMTAGVEGIIVVTFGSLVDDLPDEVAAKFVEAFTEREELILWRYSGKLPGEVPQNVKIMNWLPQNDLLAHPKTKLFITHSGNNGQHESVYHGVPMLAFPIFAEQPHNAVRIMKHGYGLKIDMHSFTAKELSEKISKIIENPAYAEKTQKMSRILKSRPMNASQTAVHWIEHVLEFGGAHLRSHALNMPWYSYYMIDILMFVQAAVFLLICSTALICCMVFRCVCNPKSKQKHD